MSEIGDTGRGGETLGGQGPWRGIEVLSGRGPRAIGALASWVAENFAAERDRWANWLPVLLGLGIAIYFGLEREPASWTRLLWVGPACLALGLRRGQGRAYLWALAATLVLIGFGVAQWRATAVAAPVLKRQIGPVTVFGTIENLDRRDDGSARVVLADPDIRGLAAADTPWRIRITVRSGAADLRPGHHIRLLAVLMPPSPPVAPGAFNFARKAWFERIGGFGYALGAPLPVAAGDGMAAAGPEPWLAAFRDRLATRIRGHDDGPAGAVAAALMTGHRRAIPEHVVSALRDSGLAHLLAISGLHVGLVAGFVFFLLRAALALSERVALNYPIKKWAAGAAFLAAVFYLFMSGATIPTQRALVMTGIILLAVITDRTAITMRPVTWAAVIILLIAPESLLSVSFQLSFAAVISLVAAYEFLRSRMPPEWRRRTTRSRRLMMYFAAVAFTTIVAEVAIGPFAAFHFNRFVAYGLVANMIAVPLMALWIMPWAVVSFLLLPLGLESWGLEPMLWGIDAVIAVATEVSSWPGVVRNVAAMPDLAIILVAAGGLWLCLWRRPWRLGGLAAIAAGMIMAANARPPDLLVDGEGKVVAVRDAGGDLVFAMGRARGLVGETWLRRAGRGRAVAAVKPGVGGDGQTSLPWLACDRLGCLYRPPIETGGGAAAADAAPRPVVAIVRDARAFADDCRTARVIVSLEPLRGACPSATVIVDRFDLWRAGSHAIWLERDRIRVETVAADIGGRPWSPYPPRRSAGTGLNSGE